MRKLDLTSSIQFILAMLLVSAASVSANDSNRQVLKDRLRFYYVDQPNNANAAYSPQLLANAAIAAGTETGAFWSNAQLGRFHELVRALLRDTPGGGDDALQYYASKIVTIVDKPVIVYLLNDATSNLTNVASDRWGACSASNNRAWPCAINMSISDDFDQECNRRIGQPVPARRDGAWAGQMALGIFNLTSGNYAGAAGRQKAYATFLHELVHTQDRSDSRSHMFWVSSRTYRYGADDIHYTTEAVPNLAMTYMEGIANTISLRFDGNLEQQMFQWFSNNDVLVVEKALAPLGAGPGTVHPCHDVSTPSVDIWLYNQLKSLNVPELPAPNPSPFPAGYAHFRIRNIPPKFIIHNEFILGLIFSEYIRHVSFNKYIAALKNAKDNLYRVSASGIAHLFDTLCTAGLPEGTTAQSLAAARESVPGPKPYLVPLAYADYFTAYRAGSKAEFAQIFESQPYMNAWIDLYWDGERENVRNSVPMTTPKWEDLTKIANTLGVDQRFIDEY